MDKPLYNMFYNLGLLTERIFACVGRLLSKTLISKIAWVFKKLAASIKKTVSSPSLIVKRIIALVLCAAIITAIVLFAPRSKKVAAYEVVFNGETIGFAETVDDAQLAEALALTKMGKNDSLKLTYNEVSTFPCNIQSADSLSDDLVKKAAPEYIKVCDIYVNNEFICSVKSILIADRVFSDILESAKKKYKNSAVSLTQNITYSYSYKRGSDDSIWTEDRLRLAIKTLDLVTPQHVESENTLSTVKYDTVEIETNTLFVGDSRERRSGENGSEYVVDLVTYIGENKVMSEHLMSLMVKAPVSRVIEKGNRAESLSMGSYTVIQTSGVFCWPVVGLNTVTSPFGERSLGYHHGLDISGANASGSLVVAGAGGTVTEAGWSNGGYGNYVIINHGNGVETLYGHMLDNSLLVSAGETVTKGQAIGRVGDTGYSFGAHLHFEVRINGNRINPAPYLGLS